MIPTNQSIAIFGSLLTSKHIRLNRKLLVGHRKQLPVSNWSRRK